ncbi:MAG: 50S ribosomal protein L22 [Patescibacteria group bacterium]|jgi:large subunit ribosomal protein L22
MEIVAKLKFARISPKKVQPLLGSLRRKPAQAALNSLRYAQTKGGKMIYKLIASAIANASNNYNAKPENLRIKSLVVEEGPRYKRYWLRSHGSADIKLKRMAHLTVKLEEILPTPSEKTAKKISPVAGGLKTTNKGAASKISAPTSSAGGPVLPTDKPAKLRGKLGGKRLFTRTTNK